MKVKIEIDKSELNLTYYIFKFKNVIETMSIIDVINKKTPIAEIVEDTSSSVVLPRQYSLLALEEGNNTRLCSKHSFISRNCSLRIELVANDDSIIECNIIIENNEIINSSIDGTTVTGAFTILNNNSILINGYKISSGIAYKDANVIEFIDNDVDGIFNPSPRVIEYKDEKVFYIEKENRKNTYTYTVISKNSNGEYSVVSDFNTVEIIENEKDLQVEAFTNENMAGEIENYSLYKTFGINEDIRFNDRELSFKEITTFNEWDINVDKSLILQKQEVAIQINNVFHMAFSDKTEYAVKSLKIRIRRKDSEVYSEFSEPVHSFNKIKKKFAGIILLIKDVTDLSDEERKIPLTDENFIVKHYKNQSFIGKPIMIKHCKSHSFIGKDIKTNSFIGEYDTSFIGEYDTSFYNVSIENLVNSNKNIEIVPEETSRIFFEVFNHALITKTYNYTVYLYNEEGKISNPIVKVE